MQELVARQRGALQRTHTTARITRLEEGYCQLSWRDLVGIIGRDCRAYSSCPPHCYFQAHLAAHLAPRHVLNLHFFLGIARVNKLRRVGSVDMIPKAGGSLCRPADNCASPLTYLVCWARFSSRLFNPLCLRRLHGKQRFHSRPSTGLEIIPLRVLATHLS